MAFWLDYYYPEVTISVVSEISHLILAEMSAGASFQSRLFCGNSIILYSAWPINNTVHGKIINCDRRMIGAKGYEIHKCTFPSQTYWHIVWTNGSFNGRGEDSYIHPREVLRGPASTVCSTLRLPSPYGTSTTKLHWACGRGIAGGVRNNPVPFSKEKT